MPPTKWPEKGKHVLYSIGDRSIDALIVHTFADSPLITLCWITNDGQTKYQQRVPHKTGIIDPIQPFWIWPEELPVPKAQTPEPELRKGRRA